MISRYLINQHHVESLDHFHAAGQLAVDTLNGLTQLSLRHLREAADIHGGRLQSVAGGQSPAPVDLDGAIGVFQASVHLLTDSYAKWVALIEEQLKLAQRVAHATFDDLQRWSPAGTEVALGAAELMMDAAESSAELVADASVAVTRSVDAQAAETTPRRRAPARRRTTAASKTA